MEIEPVRADLDYVIRLYGSALPDMAGLFGLLATKNGWIRFTPKFDDWITWLNCWNYPKLYQDENIIAFTFLRIFFENDDEIIAFNKKIEALSPPEQAEQLSEFLKNIEDFDQTMEDMFVHFETLNQSPIEQEKARLEWEKLSPEEQHQAIRLMQNSTLFVLGSFYNFFALMVHGRKMTQLVNEALQGNDESFCLAVHIDRHTLEGIPYFKERYRRAQMEGEQDFLDLITYRLRTPQLRGRIRHRLLYMLFAVLEGTHWLDDLTHREILDICDQLNLGRHENQIETENALTKRLREYRRFQQFNQKVNAVK